MTATEEAAPPRAMIAARALALEVALGAFGGAFGLLVLGPVFLRAPSLERVQPVLAGLTLCGALLAVVVRLARAGRARVRPAFTVIVLAFPALWLLAPVALATLFGAPTPPPSGVAPTAPASGADPFRVWAVAFDAFVQTFTPRTLPFSLAVGAFVPFTVVGVCVVARPRTPPLALGLLAASTGYLGLAVTFGLLRRDGLDLLLDGGRQALLCGLPCAVVAMALASRRASLADLERVDRRAWRRVGLALLALLALIGAGARGHVRHAFDALVRTQGWGNPDEHSTAFGRGVWLERLEDDPRVAVKLVAMHALGELGGAASSATPSLLRVATKNASAVVRWVAVDTVEAVSAEGVRYEATLPSMIELALRDPDLTVRAHAVGLLVRLGDPAAAAAFFDALSASTIAPHGRRVALSALQEWWRVHRRDERSPTPLAIADALIRAHADETFIDPDDAPRALYAAIVGLDFDFVQHLTRALADDDPRVRRLAALTLRGPLSYTSWRLTPAERQQVAEAE